MSIKDDQALAPPPGMEEYVASAATPTPTPGASPTVAPPPGMEDDVAAEMREDKYGGVGQQLITGLEGAASAATFGLSTGVERALGVDPKDITGRREENPNSHMAGQAAGTLGSLALGPAGAANIMTKVGAAGAKAVGLAAPASMIAKVGSAAVQGAIENAVFQGGDEIAKFIAKDPAQTADSALINMGISAVLGGAIMGTTSGIGQGAKALWKATKGAETEGVLSSIVNKFGGHEDPAMSTVDDMFKTAGINDVAPEIRAAVGDDPFVRQSWQTLQDSATSSGVKSQEAYKVFKNQMSEAMAGAVGKTSDDLANLAKLSEREIGDQIKDTISSKVKEAYDPIAKSYEKISTQFKNTPIPQDMTAELAESIAKTLDTGVSLKSPEAQLMNRVLEELPTLKNLEQMRNYVSGIGNETSGIAKQDLWNIGRKIKNAFNETEERILTRTIESEAPELAAEHIATKAAYRNLKVGMQELNDRIKVGRHGGPKTFLQALDNMDSEAVVSRLNPKGKSSIITELQASNPEAAQLLKDYHLSKILKTAQNKEGMLDSARFIKEVNKLSPEMRDFVLPPGAGDKMAAIQKLMQKLPEKVGKSGTPQGLDALMSGVPGSAVAAVTMLSSGNPALAGVLGLLTKAVARDIPDAVRLATLKFLGTNKPIDAAGFKSMASFINKTIKGENLVKESVANVFKTGVKVLPETAMPKREDLEKLDKHVEHLQTNPSPLLDMANGHASYYMPEHQAAVGTSASTVVNYLSSLRPKTDPQGPLENPRTPSATEKAQYNRALEIAQQPLVVIQKIKDGSLTSKDVLALHSMYPALYQNLLNKLTDDMIAAKDKKQAIPHKTKLGLSLFMTQPMSPSLKPMNIMKNQPLPNGSSTPGPNNGPAPKSMKSLNKLAGSYKTAGQYGEGRHNK